MELTELALMYMELGGRLVQLLNLPTLTREEEKELDNIDTKMQIISAEIRRVRCTS